MTDYTPSVDALANEIRRVDGNHSLGAGALAEALSPWLDATIRAAQAEALRGAARNLPFPADPYGGFDHESLRAAQVQHANWLREAADV